MSSEPNLDTIIDEIESEHVNMDVGISRSKSNPLEKLIKFGFR